MRHEPDVLELHQSAARNIIHTTGGLYLIWHFIATLVWPEVFSPRLWLSTILLLVVWILAANLIQNHYKLSQIIWLAGLALIIVQAYITFRQPAVTISLALLPLMATVTLGMGGTLLVQALLILLSLALQINPWVGEAYLLPPMSPGYANTIILGSLFTGFFGWALSNNLLISVAVLIIPYLYSTLRSEAEI